MRAVVQRVSEAMVTTPGQPPSRIGPGLLVLLGVARYDNETDARFLADKVAGLRIFADQNDLMNLGLADINGEVMVVSQFTLLGDCRKGRRPSYGAAAAPEQAKQLYQYFVERLRQLGLPVATGFFQEMMRVSLVNDGPVTILLDSRKLF